MKVELFTLCDGAYNYNGKLTIVGTMDAISVRSLPISIGFGIALKVLLNPEDGDSHHLRIVFHNPDGSLHPGELNVDLGNKKLTETTHISLAANVNGLPFSQEGRYTIIMYIDDKEALTSSLTVNLKK